MGPTSRKGRLQRIKGFPGQWPESLLARRAVDLHADWPKPSAARRFWRLAFHIKIDFNVSAMSSATTKAEPPTKP